ncbi:MAG: ABC transporter permease [Bacteroidales bacterium]|nr:ABC transporter permease [Bacteroidales bacterium]
MDASSFIARRLRFGGKVAMFSIAISFFIMIIAVSVSSGFREEIRNGISSLTGDVQLVPVDLNYINESSPISSEPSFLPEIESLQEVRQVTPAIYRAGIIKKGENIHGVLFKGVPVEKQESDTIKLGVSIPTRLSQLLDLHPGDKMLSYFVGENVKVRNFVVRDVYEGIMDGTDNIIVLADIKDIRRLNGWSDDEVSTLEMSLVPSARSSAGIRRVTDEVGMMALEEASDDDDTLVATSVLSRYPQIFDWLTLIDFNVLIILILMTIVAGFNMISGLLIMLFRNISTIGTLKSLGMTDRSIAKVFLKVASVIVLKGLLIGNLAALLFCFIQKWTHLLKLNPENYFVSFVPVHLNLPGVIAADVLSFLVIMVLLLIPCLFIARVDPAQTVRAQ